MNETQKARRYAVKQGELFMKHRARPVLCKCRACGHGLSDPESVERKLGPTCWAKGGGERWQIPLGFEERGR
jgi:hypothetical protein